MQQEPRKEYASTYYVQDRLSEQELVRLTIQGRMMTSAMGGPLSEPTDMGRLRRVLDIACGPGEWVLAMAKTFPTLELIGIDISPSMIQYAREQAASQQFADRVSFHVMDALLILEFPSSFFDLVNLRCCVGFMRTWDWPKMLNEMRRVTRPGGTVRVTDAEAGHICPTSPALTQFSACFQNALFQAGNLFEAAPSGLTAHLAPLLEQHGCKAVQTKAYDMTYRANTPSGQAFYEDMQRAFQTLRPFILKWGQHLTPAAYDAMCQQGLTEIQQSDFQASWNMLSAWGTV